MGQTAPLCLGFELFVLGRDGYAGWDGIGEVWVGGKDGLAKLRSLKKKRPINILSWLPGRTTAAEMLRYHKTDKFTPLPFNSYLWKTTGKTLLKFSLEAGDEGYK